MCFNTQPPEGGWAPRMLQTCLMLGFNTQPPEGGWCRLGLFEVLPSCFNTQPPEGGWFSFPPRRTTLTGVSTHSRPKAAGSKGVATIRRQ